MRRTEQSTLLISEDRPTLHLRLPVAFMAAESARCALELKTVPALWSISPYGHLLLHFNCRRHLLRFRIFLLSNLILVLFVPSTRARTEERGGDSNRGAIMTPLLTGQELETTLVLVIVSDPFPTRLIRDANVRRQRKLANRYRTKRCRVTLI